MRRPIGLALSAAFLCASVLAAGCDDAIEVLVTVETNGVDVDQLRIWSGAPDGDDSLYRTGPTVLPESPRSFGAAERFSIKLPRSVAGEEVFLVVDFEDAAIVVGSAGQQFIAGDDNRVTVRIGPVERCGDGEVRRLLEECDSNDDTASTAKWLN